MQLEKENQNLHSEVDNLRTTVAQLKEFLDAAKESIASTTNIVTKKNDEVSNLAF